ncbi:MAG: class I tRNA ligase family protein [Microthrixaceae bacterium]|nr:class I tRNA ligase family protein [Microthrixaceae bacterium]
MPAGPPDRYSPTDIEPRWQQYWVEHGNYEVDNDDPRDRAYVLCMYPYPSGSAHMGHVRNYTFGDLLARYRTMKGDAVLSPMGFDSFGLPAENAAIRTGVHPREFTDARIEELTSSLTRIGGVYDWRREVRSHDPSYIRHTQWIFLRFLEAGLAYREKGTVNWCPGCQTVLANEQVVEAAASVPTTPLSGVIWTSGTSASPTMPSSCSMTSRASTGPIVSSRSSATGSAARRASSSIWPSATPKARPTPKGFG